MRKEKGSGEEGEGSAVGREGALGRGRDWRGARARVNAAGYAHPAPVEDMEGNGPGGCPCLRAGHPQVATAVTPREQ